MNYDYQVLTKQQTNIQQLIAHSYEGGVMLVEAIIAGEAGYVVDSAKRPVHFRSVQEIKDGFHSCYIADACLVHESAYDEMIGLLYEQLEPMKIPLQLN